MTFRFNRFTPLGACPLSPALFRFLESSPEKFGELFIFILV